MKKQLLILRASKDVKKTDVKHIQGVAGIRNTHILAQAVKRIAELVQKQLPLIDIRIVKLEIKS